MKNIYSVFFALMLAVTFCFVSCKDKNEQEQKNEVNTELSPEDNKEKLMTIAQHFTEKFNTKDQEAAIELADGLYNKYKTYSWDGVAAQFQNRHADFFAMPRYAKRVMRGKAAPTEGIRTFVFNFADEAGIYEADDATKSWKYIGKSDDNSVVLRFTDDKGNACEAKLWGEGSTSYYEYEWTDTYYDYYDYEEVEGDKYVIKGQFPRNTCFSLKQLSKEVMRVMFSQQKSIDNSVELTVNAKVANIIWNVALDASERSVAATYSFNCDNEQLLLAIVNLPSYNYNAMTDGEDIQEWIMSLGDDYERVLKNINEANAIVDVMGEMQFKVEIPDVSKLYRNYLDLEENYNEYSSQKDYLDRYCEFVNTNQTNGIYYNNSIKQAEVRLQTIVEEEYIPSYTDDSYEAAEYYSTEAVIYFPEDQTSYAFEQYFNRKPFTDLISTVEDIANQYIALSETLKDGIGEVSLD